MSHIPNSAMPHAKPSEEAPEGGGSAFKALADKARENPKTAIAAGAALVAGAVAAAAIPLVRGSRGESGSGSGKKSRKKADA